MSNVKRIDDHLLAKATMAVYAINELIDKIYGASNGDTLETSLDEACKELETTVEKLKKLSERKP